MKPKEKLFLKKNPYILLVEPKNFYTSRNSHFYHSESPEGFNKSIQNTEIKVTLNGQLQEFKDETTGEAQYPITFQNRTYLPLRTVAQLAGLNVDYDSSNNTAILKYSNRYEAFYSIIKKYHDEFKIAINFFSNLS